VPDSAGVSPLTRFGTAFRLGSTSYVYPADILPNVERLAEGGEVDDVELILFEVDDGTNNLPDEATIHALRALAQEHALTYTVHLPLDLRLGADGSARHASLVKAEHVLKATAPLDPYAYVFHLDWEGADRTGWQARAVRSLEMMSIWVPRPELLAVENLEGHPLDLLNLVLEAVPLSRTVDIGHLWKDGIDPLPVLEAWLPRTRVVHIHGLRQRDHQSLAYVLPDRLDPVVGRLLGFAGVVTLEVFGMDDFFSSRDALLDSVERAHSG
jgi:sugar phosphate isomerase/epimerase